MLGSLRGIMNCRHLWNHHVLNEMQSWRVILNLNYSEPLSLFFILISTQCNYCQTQSANLKYIACEVLYSFPTPQTYQRDN